MRPLRRGELDMINAFPRVAIPYPLSLYSEFEASQDAIV